MARCRSVPFEVGGASTILCARPVFRVKTPLDSSERVQVPYKLAVFARLLSTPEFCPPQLQQILPSAPLWLF